ncbi:MAG: SGNH/GDSL hydrolase family protein, partial [Nannocystaceae bacterium]|nr:SGNH/GDSL hydrolase family protein [Nannocystaceae bacterium]
DDGGSGDGSDGTAPSDADGTTGANDDADDDADTDGDTGQPGEGVACLNDQFVNGPTPGPDYTEFNVTIGSHCQGTNHQDITDIERVVFLGDSVTVGTPPTAGSSVYRSIVALELANHFGIEAPSTDWQGYNIINGNPVEQESGAFAQCSEWGGRNNDLMSQLEGCFAGDDFDARTLIIMTSGGNDISAMTSDAIDGAPAGELFEQLESMVEFHRQTIQWLVGEDRFSNGIFVVNANVFEFTDYTAEVLSCPTAGLAGFSSNPPNTDLLLGALTLINEEYAAIAAETGTDVAFMFETMCGHGFLAGDASNVCYRGAGTENWFDATCIHPTLTGHSNVAEMFLSVITE